MSDDDDYTCRTCHATISLIDGCEIPEPELWYCESCALDEIERLRAQHRHCEHCGGTWLDDGVNAGCYCREIERLRAIVDRLPKTADGMPITPGMKVWFQRSRNHGWEVTAELVGGYWDTFKDWHCIDFDGQRCFSTREAAEAARAGVGEQ